MVRLFVGLAIPDHVQANLADLHGGLPQSRWIAGHNLHLTLCFIGDITEDLGEEIDGALASIECPAFSLSLARMDCFQSRGRVRAVWIGGDGGPNLVHLQKKVEIALNRLGLSLEGRKFTPHVTLARLKRAPIEAVSPYLVALSDVNVPKFDVDRFCLFQSHLGQAGAEYEIVAEYRLAADNLGQ